jgi:hypothetical protein
MRYLTSVLMAIFSASGSAPIHHRPPSALTQSAELDEIETLKRMFADAPECDRVLNHDRRKPDPPRRAT